MVIAARRDDGRGSGGNRGLLPGYGVVRGAGGAARVRPAQDYGEAVRHTVGDMAPATRSLRLLLRAPSRGGTGLSPWRSLYLNEQIGDNV